MNSLLPRAAHILRFAPDEIAVEWLTRDEAWTRDYDAAGNFAHLTEPEVEAIAIRTHGIIPSDCRETIRTAPRQREWELPHSSKS